MLSAIALACVSWRHQEVEYLREPWAKHLSAYVFRRAERRLFAKSYIKMISFFSRPSNPSAFQLFESFFLGSYWSDSSSFCISTTTGSRSIIIQVFGRPDFFFDELLAKKSQFSDFLEGKWYIFESCLYSKLGIANIFPLIDGTLFVWVACCDSFGQKCFAG